MRHPFRYFNSSPEVIRLAVMMYIRYPLSLRQVEDLLFERGIDICHETFMVNHLYRSRAKDCNRVESYVNDPDGAARFLPRRQHDARSSPLDGNF